MTLVGGSTSLLWFAWGRGADRCICAGGKGGSGSCDGGACVGRGGEGMEKNGANGLVIHTLSLRMNDLLRALYRYELIRKRGEM